LYGPRGFAKALLKSVLSLWRFHRFATHDPIERREISLLSPFGEERGAVHDCKLLRHRRGNELVHADAIRFRASLNLRFDG